MPIFYEVQLFKPYHLVTDTSVCSVTFEFSQEEIVELVYWLNFISVSFNIDMSENYIPVPSYNYAIEIFEFISNWTNINSELSSTFGADSISFITSEKCGGEFELRLWNTDPPFPPDPSNSPGNFIIKKGIFRPYLQKPVEENMIFDDGLSLFGVMKQRVVSKINRKENILKLRNDTTYDSIYPMLDEYGYMVVDYFIFKSTWDFEYHLEVNKPNISSVPTLQNIYQTLYIQSIVKKYNSI